MRGLFGGATALFVLWAVYVASPYVALLSLASAIVSRDVPQISDRINLRAIRLSLAKQLVSEGVTGRGAGGLAGSDGELARATITMAAEPFLERLVTDAGIAGLLGEADLGSIGDTDTLERLWRGPQEILALMSVSRWRGFRNVYFTVPPGRPASDQVRLQFRLSRLSWRLVGIDLSPAHRVRMVEAILSTRGEKLN